MFIKYLKLEYKSACITLALYFRMLTKILYSDIITIINTNHKCIIMYNKV